MASVPVTKQQIDRRPNLRVVQGKKRSPASRIALRLSVFGILAFAAFLASSLVGNVLLEGSRQQAKSAMRRSLAARDYQFALQRQVFALGGSGSIDSWAKSNGFVPTEGVRGSSSESARVAVR